MGLVRNVVFSFEARVKVIRMDFLDVLHQVIQTDRFSKTEATFAFLPSLASLGPSLGPTFARTSWLLDAVRQQVIDVGRDILEAALVVTFKTNLVAFIH